MLHDYKVRFRSEDGLAEAALSCRKFAGNHNLARFNIVDFVEEVLPRILSKMNKGGLEDQILRFMSRRQASLGRLQPAYFTCRS
jgi:hypothetical protein